MLREINDRAAIEVLLREGPLTRAELELAIGLSKPATAQLLTRLEQDDLVVKAGVRGGGRGPRAHVVIGAQGAFDPRTGLLSSAPHIPGWLGFDVPQKLSDELGVDVLIENDVNLVAVEEMTAGMAQDVDDFVMVWLSEGVGGA